MKKYFLNLIILICALFCCVSTLFAQQQQADSLKKVLSNPKLPDSMQVHLIVELTHKLDYINPAESKQWLAKAIKIAEKNPKTKWGNINKSNILLEMGNRWYLEGKLDSAIAYSKQAVVFNQSIKNPEGEALGWTGMGSFSSEKNDYTNALVYLQTASLYRCV